MTLTELTDRNEAALDTLTGLWERSVNATHLFLSPQQIAGIKEYVPQAIAQVQHLILAQNDAGDWLGFMGVENQKLEMLFLSPDQRGKGIGKQLIEYGMEHYHINEVTVNEQNPSAKAFYEHMGFSVYQRTDLDEQGDPYPLLYMRLGK